jgi:tetratricopeptide (TPR) repeat protein
MYRRLRVNIQIAILLSIFPALALGTASAQDPIRADYEAAREAHARGDLAEAERKYLEVIRRRPGMAAAYNNLGIVYLKQRRYEDAVRTLEEGLQIDPQMAGAQVVLGLAYYKRNENEKAAAAFKAALRPNPSDRTAQLYLGRAQIQMHKYQEAAQTLEKLLDGQRDDPDALFSLGLSYLKLLMQTVAQLNKVAPLSYQFWLLMAQDAEVRGQHEIAIRNYQEALRLKPDVSGTHYALGSVYYLNGKNEEAALEFEKELELNPNDSLALWKLGEIILNREAGEALPYLQRAVDLNPYLPQAIFAYGKGLARVGEVGKALEQFQRVVQMAPEEHSVHYHLARSYRRLGQTEEANKEIALFQELARKNLEQQRELTRQLIYWKRETPPQDAQPQPGFDPAREPVHD